MTERTVLLVEDSEDTRLIYATYLQHKGWRVLEAENGRVGIQVAREKLPDVIVMNVSMPVIDGLTAAELLKEDPNTSGIPIIACTAYVRSEGGELARIAGCDSYIEKPAPPSLILEEIDRLTTRTAANPLDLQRS
jgi:CheY-like chemotaxis protein